MHLLHRGPPPACLAKFQHGRNNWADVQTPEKSEIWKDIEAMQGLRCAYCETAIDKDNRHIEHFRQKGRDPTVTFLWSNLFGSCNRDDSCGKHKDRCKDCSTVALIKPDVDDPEQFLVFAPDGSVGVRKNLSPADHLRATETIRIFNLNGPLRQIRFREVLGYVQTAQEIAELASVLPEEDWLPLLQQEIAVTAQLPFATAIRQMQTRHGQNP